MKLKVLVTGAKGQLAQTIYDMHSELKTNFEFTFTSKSELDISRKELVISYFDNHNFDYCINCAAYTNVEQSEVEPEQAYKINTEGVKNLALACKANETILIHISTDYVFDGKGKIPYTEEDEVNPINVYGKSKRAGEVEVQNILDKFFIIRVSWLYSKHGHNFVKTIVNKIQENSDLTIITTQVGTPTNCIELSEFILFLMSSNSKAFGLYHFSSFGQTTWYDFAVEIAKEFESYDQSKIKPIRSFKTKAKRPKFSVLNTDKSSQIFKKEYSWKEEVKRTVKSLK